MPTLLGLTSNTRENAKKKLGLHLVLQIMHPSVAVMVPPTQTSAWPKLLMLRYALKANAQPNLPSLAP